MWQGSSSEGVLRHTFTLIGTVRSSPKSPEEGSVAMLTDVPAGRATDDTAWSRSFSEFGLLLGALSLAVPTASSSFRTVWSDESREAKLAAHVAFGTTSWSVVKANCCTVQRVHGDSSEMLVTDMA